MALSTGQIESILNRKGYTKYAHHDFYDLSTYVVKFGRNAAHVGANVNGANSGWANATHIILPYERDVNVIREATYGQISSFLNTKLNHQKPNTFIYQPTAGYGELYQKYVFSKDAVGCHISAEGEPDTLDNLISDFVPPQTQQETPQQIQQQTPQQGNTVRFQNTEQIIFYGVPGSGKSTAVSQKLDDNGIDANHYKRVVFYCDYTNSDFVGQVYPSLVNGEVTYTFKPGPFSEILRKAYENPTEPFCLLIEEINRGNAPAIFGDIFQLLDRKKNGCPVELCGNNSYGAGWSDYSVSNSNLNSFIRGEFDSTQPDDVLNRNFGDVILDKDTEIRLPSNLSIYATMNTSDQNVFTLDNAFQRRWKMKLVKNKLDETDPEQVRQKGLSIQGSSVLWGDFVRIINKKIVETASGSNFSSLEDKRIGVWFITPENNEITKEDFSEKVLKYLWDDAFKFDRSIFRNSEGKTFEDIVEDFMSNNHSDCLEIFECDFEE